MLKRQKKNEKEDFDCDGGYNGSIYNYVILYLAKFIRRTINHVYHGCICYGYLECLLAL